MSTLTLDQQDKITTTIASMGNISSGLGNIKSACSIAAINLALTGELTDNTPDCMSLVIGGWLIKIQDVMPDEMRNSKEWRELLPHAAGTGRDNESRRLDVIMDWMWNTVLPQVQPYAESNGFGSEWTAMCVSKTAAAAKTATHAYADTAAKTATHAYDDTAAAYAAYAAAHITAKTTARIAAAKTAAHTAHIAAGTTGADAAYTASYAAAKTAAGTTGADAAYEAARAAGHAGIVILGSTEYWTTIDPIKLLAILIDIGE